MSTRLRGPVYAAGTRAAAAACPGNRAINGKDQDRSDDRSDKAGGLSFRVPPDGSSQDSRDDGTGYTQQNRDNYATGITARHEHLCKYTNHQADKYHP